MNPTIQALLRVVQGETLSPHVIPSWLRMPEDSNAIEFWKLAEIHGLDFVIYQRLVSLKRWEGCVPPELRTTARENLLNNLELVAWLEGFHTKARELDLPVFCFKGPALAAAAYDGMGCRGAGDIDLLVDPSDVNRAAELLGSMGFKSVETLRGRDYREFHFHIPFIHSSGLEVELHWAISRKSCRVDFEMSHLWSRRVPLRLFRETVDGLSAEDHLLILCVHGTRHLWERLIWLHDLAALLRRETALDWDYVVHESKRLGCFRMLVLGVYLTDLLLKESAPTELLRSAFDEPTVLQSARTIIARYGDDEPELGAFQRDWSCLILRERLIDKLAFLGAFPLAEYCDLWVGQAMEATDAKPAANENMVSDSPRSRFIGLAKRSILGLLGRRER